jgi:hypothetical protein
MRYNAVWSGRILPTFQRNVQPSSLEEYREDGRIIFLRNVGKKFNRLHGNMSYITYLHNHHHENFNLKMKCIINNEKF